MKESGNEINARSQLSLFEIKKFIRKKYIFDFGFDWVLNVF
jgi:hypothetical protein